MSQYTDKLGNRGFDLISNRLVEMKRDDVNLIASWFFKNVNITPTFKDMYKSSCDSFLKKCSLNNKVMEFMVPLKDVVNALYWAELLDIENKGTDVEKQLLAYLVDVKTNEHMKKKAEKEKAEKEAKLKEQQELAEQKKTAQQIDQADLKK